VDEQLEADHFDILMSGLPGSVSLYQEMLLATPHLELTPALLVPDHRRAEFATHELLLDAPDVRIGVDRNDPYIIQKLRDFLPDATIVQIESVRAFLEGTTEPIDALAISAEAGSAWSLLYPSFGVVFSLTDVVGWPSAYPLASDDPAFATFFNQWIELKRSDGTIQRAYDYWILGRNAVEREPRWSIMRDVLHWGR
jgi:ABC-type amino acid transport substrate-binding protein